MGDITATKNLLSLSAYAQFIALRILGISVTQSQSLRK